MTKYAIEMEVLKSYFYSVFFCEKIRIIRKKYQNKINKYRYKNQKMNL